MEAGQASAKDEMKAVQEEMKAVKEEMKVGQEEMKRVYCIIENKFEAMEGTIDGVENKVGHTEERVSSLTVPEQDCSLEGVTSKCLQRTCTEHSILTDVYGDIVDMV
ncbi:hypothetical protein X975_17086, partial [Stegodyphus mimosarum]